MSDNVRTVAVELSTPRGESFTWTCSSVEVRSVEGVIEINPLAGNYLSMSKPIEITLRRAGVFFSFMLENATANLKEGRLIVLAEKIRPVEPAHPAAKLPQ